MKYSAYGVCLDSDFALAGLPEALGKASPTIRLSFRMGRLPDVTGKVTYSENLFHGRRIICLQGREYDFHVENVGAFRIAPEKDEISIQPVFKVSPDALRYWLLRFMLPFHRSRENNAVLFHGSAVKAKGGAVAFLADSFGGKSTLSDYLQQQGHPFITDDDLLIEGAGPFMAHSSIPFVRSHRHHEDLGHLVDLFAHGPEPLRKIYILEWCDAPVRVIPLSAKEVAVRLIRHQRFRWSENRAQRFRFSARLASAVPAARLTVPPDLSRLSEVHGALLRDFETYS